MIGYKYRNWKDAYHKELLTERKLYFNSANDFNDLFDASIELNHEDIPKKEYLDYLKKILLIKDPQAIYDPLLEEKIKSAFLNKQDSFSEFSKYKTEEIKKMIGIYSLSLEKNSVHNWAYYGDGNKGYCVGIDFESIFNKHSISCIDVQYLDEYPNIISDLTFDSPIPLDIIRIISLKSMAFEKEKEIRLFKFKGVGHVIKFDTEDVKEIILGNKIDPEHKKEIYDIWEAVYPHASLSKIKIKPKTFELEVVPYS